MRLPMYDDAGGELRRSLHNSHFALTLSSQTNNNQYNIDHAADANPKPLRLPTKEQHLSQRIPPWLADIAGQSRIDDVGSPQGDNDQQVQRRVHALPASIVVAECWAQPIIHILASTGSESSASAGKDGSGAVVEECRMGLCQSSIGLEGVVRDRIHGPFLAIEPSSISHAESPPKSPRGEQ